MRFPSPLLTRNGKRALIWNTLEEFETVSEFFPFVFPNAQIYYRRRELDNLAEIRLHMHMHFATLGVALSSRKALSMFPLHVCKISLIFNKETVTVLQWPTK